jgi:hypothetical protein
MCKTSKGLVLAVLAYQVAALMWNDNSKLRTLCVLLGYQPLDDEALTGWKFPSLQKRLNFLQPFSTAPDSKCSELIRNLRTRSSTASWFANVHIFSPIRKWFPFMYRQLYWEYASILGHPLDKDDPDPDYTWCGRFLRVKTRK